MSEVRSEAETPSFFELYSRGDVAGDSIHDHIDAWHDRFQGVDDHPPLHDYLGLTRDEYEVWLYDPFSLPCIRQSRLPGRSLDAVMAERLATLRAASRREDATIILSLENWLKRQPRR